MSAIGSEIKKRYDVLNPSDELLDRTEQMMADEAEKDDLSAHRRLIGSVAGAMALLCLLIMLITMPGRIMPDHVHPIAADPDAANAPESEITAAVTFPALAPDSREFTLNETSVLSPAGEYSAELAEGVTLDVHTIGTTKDGVFAEWTVRSSLPETVYYSLEYDISFSDELPPDYLFSAGIGRSIDCFRNNSESLALEVPTLYALTPDKPENSGSFLHTYSSTLPESEISVRFVLHAYAAANGEVTDWGEQGVTTAHAKKYIPVLQHLGDMRVYGLPDGSCINNIPAYQESLIELQEEKGAGSMIYLEALTKSGVFRKITEETHEYSTAELQVRNTTELTGLVFSLPDRTIEVQSLSITADTLQMRYTVLMSGLAYAQENAGFPENCLYYVMDDQGNFIASAAEGNVFHSGMFTDTAYEGPDGMQAYDCWLRLGIDISEMPEYFVFAPHKQEVGQYSGTNAEKFERLFSVTAPEECFAVTPGGEIIQLDSRAQENSGIRFTLDSTECTSGRIGMEWTVESTLEHDIFYFVESDFIPADGVWDVGHSDAFSADHYGETALFAPPGKLLTPDEPAYSGRKSYVISSTEPCPGGEVVLTLHAFRAPDKSGLSGDFYSELLMDLYDQSEDDPGRYASLITDSGLFVEETKLEQRFSVPPYENATKAMIENTQFDFGGRTITIRDLRVTPTGMDMRYEISGADFSAYTGEREYEDMYFVVTAYGSAVGLGHIDKGASTDSVRCGAITESDWDLEKIPEYIVLVPYGPMSADEYMELRKSRHSGEMFERLREIYYHETDQNDCIRIYMDGRVTTNTLENRRTIRTRTVESAPPLSTISEPEPNILDDAHLFGDRAIRLEKAWISSGRSALLSMTEEGNILHLEYQIYAPYEEGTDRKDGWTHVYFPVLPDGTLPENYDNGYSSINEDGAYGVTTQSCNVPLPNGEIPEYITFVPMQNRYSDLTWEEEAIKLAEDAAAADPAQCFRLVIGHNGTDYVFSLESPPLSTPSKPEEPSEFTRIDLSVLPGTPDQPQTHIIQSKLSLGERELTLYYAGIDDGYATISSATEEDSIFSISYHVSAPSDGTYGYNDGWKFTYFPVLPDGTIPADSSTGYGMLLDENDFISASHSNTVIFPKGSIPEHVTYVPFQRNYPDLPLDEQDEAMLVDAATVDPAQCFRLLITNTGDEENPAYNFSIRPVLIDGPYKYESFFESQGRRVGIFRSEFASNSQYIAYSYAVHADEYEKYLDAENYDGLYFAAIISGGEAQFISGHKGISTNDGEKYWQGVINGNLQFDTAPEEVLLVPYPDGLTKDAFVEAKADGKVEDMLRGFFEQADPDDCIPLFTSSSDAQV